MKRSKLFTASPTLTLLIWACLLFVKVAHGQSPLAQANSSSPLLADAISPIQRPIVSSTGEFFPITNFQNERFDGSRSQLGTNFIDIPQFDGGLTIYGDRAALKIGGYVKADLITDFDAIDSTDTFDTSTIPTMGLGRRNARFHARQTRLSFDTRWKVSDEIARAFLEVDFFGDRTGANNSLRLRHAYGRLGNLTVGQTWTTFTDPSAVPQTLDFEGGVSNVNRRQGLVRLQTPLAWDGFSFAVGVENPRITIEVPLGVQGDSRTETPDFITNLRYEQDWCEFQTAMVFRELGFQPIGSEVLTETAWGFNFTGSVRARTGTKAYYQITFGEGIGSYRGSPDVVATGATTAEVLPIFGWMIGVKQQLSKSVTTNITYSALQAEAIPGQAPDNLRETTYFAANVIHKPYENFFWGIEFLTGSRVDQSLARGEANRLQVSCGFTLP